MKITNDTQLVYIVEDEPYVGTLKDWARAQEQAHYSGLFVSMSVYVVTPGRHDDPGALGFQTMFPQIVDQRHSSPEDVSWHRWHRYVTYRLGNAEATVTTNLDA